MIKSRETPPWRKGEQSKDMYYKRGDSEDMVRPEVRGMFRKRQPWPVYNGVMHGLFRSVTASLRPPGPTAPPGKCKGGRAAASAQFAPIGKVILRAALTTRRARYVHKYLFLCLLPARRLPGALGELKPSFYSPRLDCNLQVFASRSQRPAYYAVLRGISFHVFSERFLIWCVIFSYLIFLFLFIFLFSFILCFSLNFSTFQQHLLQWVKSNTSNKNSKKVIDKGTKWFSKVTGTKVNEVIMNGARSVIDSRHLCKTSPQH